MGFDLPGRISTLLLVMRARILKSWLSGGPGLLLAATVAVAAPADADRAIPSPFLPPGGAPAAAATTHGAIEYHGYMATAGGERFSIYDTAKKSATWVGLNERGSPFVVRSHRLVGGSTDQITVDYQGASMVLALKEAKITSVTLPNQAVFGLRPELVPAPGPAPAGSLPVGASLDEWAAEVQRRRALRQQAAQPSGAPTTTAGPPPARAGFQPGGSQR